LVALLAEGVDRNQTAYCIGQAFAESPSSRRAWIEMLWSPWQCVIKQVALLAEGVDRNFEKKG